MKRYRYNINGIVQGVGMRPYIYNLALKLKLKGEVYNYSGGVVLELQGLFDTLKLFEKEFFKYLPPLANIDIFKKENIKLKDEDSFTILESQVSYDTQTSICGDTKICEKCLEDIEKNPRYQNYFHTSCPSCGPRYSIVKKLPYDRACSSMDRFKLCVKCQDEYNDPKNRRYHTQAICCKECGPSLVLSEKDKVFNYKDKQIVEKTATFIKDGKIGAIKGLGGFHIVCDATNTQAIDRLRVYKNRPSKPFAMMCKDISEVKSIANLNKKEEQLLLSKESPIVLLDKLERGYLQLSDSIAKDICKIGCFLPYTALHHLLFRYLENPIVATSANISSEPIITTKSELLGKLPFLDFIVDYDREIINSVDDSIVQVVDGDIQTLRASRGFTPMVLKLKEKTDKKILALGGQSKATFSLIFDDNIIVSPYLGDMASLKAIEHYTNTLNSFISLYNFTPDTIVCDKHENYETTKIAKKMVSENKNIKLIQIQHHLSHLYSVKAEHILKDKNYTAFIFDGTGVGDDGKLWGGEVFVDEKRKYYFKPIKLLGADKAIKEPRRVALSLLFDNYSLKQIVDIDLDFLKTFKKDEIKLLYNIYKKSINTPLSSSVGRLFDAVASLSGILHYQTYEGEAGLLLENYYDTNFNKRFDYTITNGLIDIKFDFFSKDIVSLFFNTLVDIVLNISKIENRDVILSGGVFQNKTLLSKILRNLKNNNIESYTNQTTLPNDSGISIGQAYKVINN